MTDNTTATQSPTGALPRGEEELELQSGEDLANQALSASSTSSPVSLDDGELDKSNELAETLGSLQNVIERNANELERIKDEMKQKRESLKSVFENDAQLTEAEEQAETISQQVKERRSTLKASPQASSLNTQVAELREQMKEVEETLNNHLLNYFSLTHSMSFDTSDGDQWDFNVRAKLKGKPNS